LLLIEGAEEEEEEEEAVFAAFPLLFLSLFCSLICRFWEPLLVTGWEPRRDPVPLSKSSSLSEDEPSAHSLTPCFLMWLSKSSNRDISTWAVVDGCAVAVAVGVVVVGVVVAVVLVVLVEVVPVVVVAPLPTGSGADADSIS
jgi:hypothetical protein